MQDIQTEACKLLAERLIGMQADQHKPILCLKLKFSSREEMQQARMQLIQQLLNRV